MQSFNIKDLSPGELEDYFSNINEKSFRVKQVSKWLYQKYVNSFDGMTDLSYDLRERLKTDFPKTTSLKTIETLRSADGTIKYLFELEDGKRIESVLIPEKNRNTLCVSSQVGCALGCTFCLTGVIGKIRNLTPAEIVDQYLHIRKENKINNIVFMGMGEPLDNLENLVTSIELLTGNDYIAMSQRRITVSTSGLVPRIRELAKRLAVNLSVSLNAPNDNLRNRLMPINKKYSIKDLKDSVKNFPFPKRKLLTFEYVLLNGVNDSDKLAFELVDLLKDLNCKVNLIPFNEADPLPYKSPSSERVSSFQKILVSSGINARVRRNRGRDILGACGQLAARYPVSNN